MSIIQIMVTIIIVTILVTVILGVASYAAYWLRRGRRPAELLEIDTAPRFFCRYAANGDGKTAGEESEVEAIQIDSPVPRHRPRVVRFTPVTDSGNGGSGR
jgi:Tfp pilus assembly protein PilE